jgi:hypothetical protein
MKKLIAVCAVLSLAAVAPGALASGKGKHRAKVYRATLAPVVYGADQAYSGIEGKAQMVDNKRRDKVSIHMRGLAPRTTYPWHVHVIANAPKGTKPCAANAAQGPIVTDFTYRKLRTNKRGRASSKGSSRTFQARRADLYYIDVHDPATGAPIACGVLKTKKSGKGGHKGGRDDRGKSRDDRGRGRDDNGRHKGHGPDHD